MSYPSAFSPPQHGWPTAASPSMTPSARYSWLDLTRGASALAVTAGHLRLATMRPFGELSDPTPFQTAFYLATGLGSQAVMVFFVLSGFLVGGSVVRAGERFRFSEYLAARLVRLWVPLLPALLFTLGMDALTLAHAPQVAAGGFHTRWTSGPTPGSYSTGPLAFAGNLAFLNTITVPSYGTNGPLWTLACEFWYYVLFPLAARAVGLVGRRDEWVRRAAAGAAAVGVMAVMPRMMSGGLVVWLMGVAVAVVVARPSRPSGLLTTAVAAVGFVLALGYSKLDYLGYRLPVPSQYVVGLAFAGLAVTLCRLPPPGRVVRRVATATANISYSLYLTHFPLVVFLAVRWYADAPAAPTPANLLAFAIWFAVLVAGGWVFWLAFERHSGLVRAWVWRTLDIRAEREPGREG